MEKIGRSIHQLRVNKGMSIRYLAQGIMSDSHLGKVERGETTTNIDNFFSLLFRLNTSLEEFLVLDPESPFSWRNQLLFGYARFFTEGSVDELGQLAELALQYYRKNHDEVFLQLNELMQVSIAFISSGHDYQVVQGQAVLIQKYLGSLEFWSIYDYTIFTNVLFALDLEMIQYLGKKALQANFNHTISSAQKVVTAMAYNITVVLIENRQYQQGLFFVEESLKLAKKNMLALELIVAKIAKNIIYSNIRPEQYDDEELEACFAALILLEIPAFSEQLMVINKAHNTFIDNK